MAYAKLDDVLSIIREENHNLAGLIQHIEEHCPTADVEEVVRCKDCKHRRKTAFRSYCLPVFGLKQITDLNSFCSYGERRTDNDL